MGTLDDLPPAIRAEPYPPRLYSPVRIHIMILSEYAWDAYYLLWTLGGGPEQATRILERPSSPSGTIDFDFFPVPGGRYTLQVQGCPLPKLEGEPRPPHDEACSKLSNLVSVVAPASETSVRAFLAHNGVDLSGAGLRSFGVPSLRGLLGGARRG